MDPLDLKFTPDWLKEEAPANRYRDYAGETEPRSTGNKRGRKAPGDRGERRPDRRPARSDHPASRDRNRAPQPREERPLTGVRIEFIPEPVSAAQIAKQIKTSGKAYPLANVAWMFLERPERHRVRITATSPDLVLYGCAGDGPVGRDKAAVERQAFDALKDQFYAQEIVQGDPPKGNYSNVAKCRLCGTLIAPTNHHSYQTELRRLYDERYSRRMSFADFQREIITVREPEAIEAWREKARMTTSYRTTQEPVETFASKDAVREHFGKTHLPGLVRAAASFEISGQQARQLSDAGLNAAARAAWESEQRFPEQMLNQLRAVFHEAHLHIFRQGTRRQFVSGVRPRAVDRGQAALAPNIAAILETISTMKAGSRKDLADKLLAGAEDLEARKTALLTDLHWLIASGHVIEYHDGILALPVEKSAPPKSPPSPEATGTPSVSAGPPDEIAAPTTPNEPLPDSQGSV